MVRENDLVAVFHSVHRVMKAEKVLKLAGLEVLLIPTPRELTSDCGLALRFAPEHHEAIRQALAGEGLEIIELYRKREGKYLAV